MIIFSGYSNGVITILEQIVKKDYKNRLYKSQIISRTILNKRKADSEQ